MLANGRSQFLLDRLGRFLKLLVSTHSTSCHEFASQFGLEVGVNFVMVRRTDPSNSDNQNGDDGLVCACVRVRACVMCLQYTIIIPRLIMIIIKIIFLYFIEIAHTDDFPSTGTRLVNDNTRCILTCPIRFNSKEGAVRLVHRPPHLPASFPCNTQHFTLTPELNIRTD